MTAYKYTFTVNSASQGRGRVTVQPATNLKTAVTMLQRVARIPAGCVHSVKREIIK